MQFCLQKYAFAINQFNDCWCSDYAPSTTVDISKCNYQCPGYPDDICGADNLFAYQALNVKPSGTVSSGFSSTSSQSPSSSTVSHPPLSFVWDPICKIGNACPPRDSPFFIHFDFGL